MESNLLLTHESQLPVFCEQLVNLAPQWMIRAALKATEDLLNPDNQRKKLEEQKAKAWEEYSALFHADRFKEAAVFYADYLELKQKLEDYNLHA